MIRRPPRSTLFPYRRSSDLGNDRRRADRTVYAARGQAKAGRIVRRQTATACGGFHRRRSEEHTSELQSQSNLVCRLLLEKKKSKKHNTTSTEPESTPDIPQS